MSVGLVWAGVGIYVLIVTVVAFMARGGMGSGSLVDYFLWNRDMGGIVGALSYAATTYSAFMLVGLAGLTYAGGVGALGFEMVYFSGLVLVAFFGPRFLLVGKKFGYVTTSEMLGDRYGSRAVAVVVALANCVFLIPYSAVQLAGVGYLLDGTTGGAIPFLAGTVIVVLAVSSSAGLVVTVPAIVRAFFWRRGTAAGVLASVVLGGALVAFLELAGLRPLGGASGVWGFVAAVVLYVGVSFVMKAPEGKAAEFIGYLKRGLKDRGAV